MARRRLLSERSGYRVILAAMCLAAAGGDRLVAQSPEVVYVYDARPLAGAITEFGKRCQCVITYEDVKWSRDQVVPAPPPARRPPGEVPLMRPNGIPFWFTVPPSLSQMTPQEIEQSFGAVMSTFERSQDSGQFKLVQGKTALHVLPARSSILERRISVTANDVGAGLAVDAVLAEVARVSGNKLDTWVTTGGQMTKPVRIQASDEPGYEVLTRVVAAVDSHLSWQLLYDVNTSIYFLNIFAYKDGPRYFPN